MTGSFPLGSSSSGRTRVVVPDHPPPAQHNNNPPQPSSNVFAIQSHYGDYLGDCSDGACKRPRVHLGQYSTTKSRWLLEPVDSNACAARLTGRFFIKNESTGQYLRGGFASETTVDVIGCKREWEQWDISEFPGVAGKKLISLAMHASGAHGHKGGHLRGDPDNSEWHGAVLLTSYQMEREQWTITRIL
jgi:hypothetical protein